MPSWISRPLCARSIATGLCRPLPALRQGAAVLGLPRRAPALRGLRARYSLRRCRRRAGGLRHPDRRLHRGRRRADRRGRLSAAVLGARGAVGAADPRRRRSLPLRPIKGLLIALQYHHAGRRRPARARAAVTRSRAAARAADLSCPALFVLAALGGADRARHLAARAQGLEGRPDRRRSTASSPRRRPICRRASAGRSSIRRDGRIPPRRVSGRVRARRGGAGLYERLGAAPRREAARATGCSRRARLTGGSLVVVNRGFVPEGQQDPKTRPAGPAARAWSTSSA